eukprot:TRINITY_DN3398_c0_g1_i1.p1 TRINITY_DN3398_c0_g1~~TRINITY_DN3398_c0_g1_i1.p1  ORF type:complete len:390 (+),score=66.18 TRINITY_DN3398_c0_g1_i1:345-1514(+)
MGLSGTLLGTKKFSVSSASHLALFPRHLDSRIKRNSAQCLVTAGLNVGIKFTGPPVGSCFLSCSPSFNALREAHKLSRRSIACFSAESLSSAVEKDVQKDFPRANRAILVGSVILLLSLLVTSFLPIFTAFGATRADSVAKTGASAAITVGLQISNALFKTEFVSAAWSGFLAGCLHTLSGPDHLAALAPLSIGRTKMESAIVGALWGCGHDAGQVIFGVIFLLLKDRLRIEIVRAWGTRVVGMTLLVIGAIGIREATEVPTPCVSIDGGECDVAMAESAQDMTSGKKKVGLATFATGIIHGLQPDALMVILPALALPSRLAGSAYLCMFLCGTVMAMGSYTVFIGSCSEALKKRVPRITEKLTWVSSLIAITFGVGILFSQLFGFSLF